MTVVIDTGPLVALLNRRDQFHDWARASAAPLDPPLHSCEAVLAEAHYLLSGVQDGTRRLNELMGSGRFDLSFRYASHAPRVHALMEKYATVPMSFADACLVVLAETLSDPVVFTLAGDFAVYRYQRNRAPNLLISR